MKIVSFKLSALIIGLGFLSSANYLAGNSADPIKSQENISPENQESAPSGMLGMDEQPSGPTKFTADGSMIHVEKGDFSIALPEGWEANLGREDISVIAKEPEKEYKTPDGKIDYDAVRFRRNLTVTVKTGAMPMDETSAKLVAEGLTAENSKKAMMADFQVLESSFIDYKAKKDGMLLYTSFRSGNFDMMQMVVILSGQNYHYVLTYTDLANKFDVKSAEFEKIWNSLMSIQYDGLAPARYEEYIKYGIAAGALILLILCLGLMRKIAFRRKLGSIDYDDDLSDSDTSSDEDWNIPSLEATGTDDVMFVSESENKHATSDLPISQY